MASSKPLPRPIVLVVEDESLLRMHAVALIEDAGFDTVEAWNADQAVAILEARTDIRVVFTDIDLPGSMDGMKLAAAIRNRWPPIELILTSGYKAPGIDAIPARTVFFPKPYQDIEVLSAIKAFTT
jgi:CheY-like chemotaxis protein